ncbi:hypothetical protein D3C71_1982580 [compost metagenome]
MLGKQSFVGCDHLFAMQNRFFNDFICWVNTTHDFNHNIDIRLTHNVEQVSTLFYIIAEF